MSEKVTNDMMGRAIGLINWQDDVRHTPVDFVWQAIEDCVWPATAVGWLAEEVHRRIEILTIVVYDYRAVQILTERGFPLSLLDTFRQRSCRHPGSDPIYFEDWLDHLPGQELPEDVAHPMVSWLKCSSAERLEALFGGAAEYTPESFYLAAQAAGVPLDETPFSEVDQEQLLRYYRDDWEHYQSDLRAFEEREAQVEDALCWAANRGSNHQGAHKRKRGPQPVLAFVCAPSMGAD